MRRSLPACNAWVEQVRMMQRRAAVTREAEAQAEREGTSGGAAQRSAAREAGAAVAALTDAAQASPSIARCMGACMSARERGCWTRWRCPKQRVRCLPRCWRARGRRTSRSPRSSTCRWAPPRVLASARWLTAGAQDGVLVLHPGSKSALLGFFNPLEGRDELPQLCVRHRCCCR